MDDLHPLIINLVAKMPIPTRAQISVELQSFTEHSNVEAKQVALQVLQSLDSLAQQQLPEAEITAFADELVTSSANQVTTFNTIQVGALSFHKALYHVFLYIAYHHPRNDKTEAGIALDLISREPIAEENLFISFDQRLWDAPNLMTWFKTCGEFKNPANKELFSEQETKWIKTIALAQAIVKLSSNEENLILEGFKYLSAHPEQLTVEIIPTLIGFLHYQNAEILMFTMNALKHLAQNKIESFEVFRERGGMTLLLTLLAHHNEDIVVKATTLLSILTKGNTANQNAINKRGELALLSSLLSHKDGTIVFNIVTILGYLVANNSVLTSLDRMLPQLLILLVRPDEDIIWNTTFLFRCLSENNSVNRNLIRENGGIFRLLNLLSLQNHNVLNNVIRALGSLALDNSTHQNAMREAGGIRRLVPFLAHQNKHILFNTFRALALLARDNRTNQNAIREAGAIPLLLRYLNSSTSQNIMDEVEKCYRNLCKNNRANQEAFRDAGAVSAFVLLLDNHKDRRYFYSNPFWWFCVESLEQLITSELVLNMANATLHLVQDAPNQTQFVYDGLSLLTHNCVNLRNFGRRLLNNISLDRSARQENYPELLNDINFEGFMQSLLQKIIEKSKYLSNLNSRTYKKEKLEHYVTLIHSLMTAKKNLLSGGTEEEFKQLCTQALATAKLHILANPNNRAQGFFRPQEPFGQKLERMEEAFLALASSAQLIEQM